jgi:hypothetical protein
MAATRHKLVAFSDLAPCEDRVIQIVEMGRRLLMLSVAMLTLAGIVRAATIPPFFINSVVALGAMQLVSEPGKPPICNGLLKERVFSMDISRRTTLIRLRSNTKYI